MITCRELAELLIDYVDGTLPDGQRRQLEEHLCGCRACDDYLQSYRVTIKLTRALPCQELPPELVARLRRFLEENCR